MDCSGNWTETMEELLDRDDLDAAISLLESVVSRRLQTSEDDPPSSPPPDPHLADLRLAVALSDLADLQYARGFSLKADELRARSLLLRQRAQHSTPAVASAGSNYKIEVVKEFMNEETKASPVNNDDEDDWEAIVDRQPPDIGITRSLANELGESKAKLEMKSDTPKRRGRGSFMYNKDYLYSDEQSLRKEYQISAVEEDLVEDHAGENDISLKTTGRFGTHHILVLYDFSPSTRTTDLEKYFEKVRDSEVVIRWVNDTCALAVFQTPASASNAQNNITFPFKVRLMDENDSLLNQVSRKDLEPPLPRPKTSARAAHRMIAQVMGLKPSPDFGSKELKKQEQARKERIRARQIMRDDAWGPDDP